MVNFKSQRGAMFGLDARIAMAIIGALSLVGGTTMFMTSADVKAKALAKDLEAYKAAVDSMEYDLKARLTSTINPPVDNQSVIFALNDKSYLLPGYQPNWLGPYIKSRQGDMSKHENYGDVGFFLAAKDDPFGACNPCFKWLYITDVPQKDFLIVNQIFDGDEASPETTGRVWWATSGFSGTITNPLALQIGKSL